MGMAASFGWRMFTASLACFVHALFPFAFLRTGSNTISQLHARMVSNRITNSRACGSQ
jgi:hypothetical protein